MVTGASTADLAVILIDARKGVLTQTRRHSFLVSLIGIRRVVLAVNKMDLVGFDESVFDGIRDDFVSVARLLGVEDVVAIPLSALQGDNVVDRSEHTPWYDGPTLLEHLEAVPVGADPALEPFRFPVQYVIRPQTDEHHDHRGYSGRVVHGVVRVGDAVVVLPSGRATTIAAIDGLDGSLVEAFAPQSVSIRLADDVDVSRGDLIAAHDEAASPSQDLEGDVCVVSDRAIAAGDRVLVRHGTRTVRAKVVAVSSRLDLVSLESSPYSDALVVNDIGRLSLRLAEPVAADDYSHLRRTGAFLLVDEQDGSTLAAGMAVVARCSEG
jgi:sulfate adenylyltransferase subunit 1